MQMKLLVLVCGVWHEGSHVSSWHLVFGLQTSRSGSVEGTRLRVSGFGPGVLVVLGLLQGPGFRVKGLGPGS